MRPSTYFCILCCFLIVTQLIIFIGVREKSTNLAIETQQMKKIVDSIGLTDLCIATDARYIRHLSVSDYAASHMDHPGAIEYFPSSSFRVPVN